MAISMTGFGSGEFKNEDWIFQVECKSINHKYSDVSIRMPRKIAFMEERLRKLAKDYIKRGRMEIFVKFERLSSNSSCLKYDESLATQYFEVLSKIKSNFSLNDEISAKTIASFPDVVKVEESKDDEDLIWSMLNDAATKAFVSLIEMRKDEGSKLALDIVNRCDIMSNYVDEVENSTDGVIEEYKEKLHQRIKEILDDKFFVDDTRLAQEVAIYVDKSNITEEIVRFRSHIDQLKTTVDKNTVVGRKLDFIIQEMNREVNTMGSKSSDIKITNAVVEMKSELEKVREQVQNIE